MTKVGIKLKFVIYVMFDYLQKFNSLSKELRDNISTPAVMSTIGELEQKYGVDLAVVVMKVMIKEINVNGLDKYFSQEFQMDPTKSGQLAMEMKARVFGSVVGYLDINTESKISVAEEGIGLTSKSNNSSGSNFFFDIEDEEEIKDLIKKAGGEEKKTKLNIDGMVSEIIKKADINFGSNEMKERFKNILTIHVRGVRDKIETKQTLQKPFDSGGMGFDTESSIKTMKIAEEVKLQSTWLQEDTSASSTQGKKEEVRDVASQPASQSQAKIEDIVRDIDYDFSALSEKKTKIKKEDDINPSSDIKKFIDLDVEHELAPPPPVVVKEKQPIESSEKEIQKEAVKAQKEITPPSPVFRVPEPAKIYIPVATPQEEVKPVIKKRIVPEVSGKIKMDDIKKVSRVMSPIDELKYMDLVNFRRLNNSPEEAAAKIKEKVNLLEEDEYSKRLEGIKAWRTSPIYNMYLKIGNDSMSTKQSIDVIIDNMKADGEDAITSEEFTAIMNLNKSLRF